MTKRMSDFLLVALCSLGFTISSCAPDVQSPDCVATEQSRTFLTNGSIETSRRITACAPTLRATDLSCSTLISGQQVRQYFSSNPGQILPLPLAGRTYSLIPDQTAGEYYVKLSIGSDVIQFVADTGSSNIIVDANDFSVDPTKYIDQSFYISYASGAGLAQKYAGNVGLNCVDTSVPYTMGVLQENQTLPNILGLAYPSLAVPALPQAPLVPFLDQVSTDNSGTILEMFGMALCGHKSGHAIILGGPHPSVAQSALTYVPIIKQSHYSIDARSMHVLDWNKVGEDWLPLPGAVTLIGDFPILQPDGNGIATIVDSGSTMNIFPAEIYTNAIAVLKAASVEFSIPPEFWTAKPDETDYKRVIPPATIAHLPKFQIVVRGMNGEFVNLNLLPDTYLKQLDTVGQRTSSFRKGSFLTILGQAFMEGYYVEFDRVSQPNRIGFASNVGVCTET